MIHIKSLSKDVIIESAISCILLTIGCLLIPPIMPATTPKSRAMLLEARVGIWRFHKGVSSFFASGMSSEMLSLYNSVPSP